MNIVNGWCVLILKKIWLGGTSFFFLAGSGGFALSPAGSSDIPTIQGRCSLDYNCKTNMDKSYHWTPTHTHRVFTGWVGYSKWPPILTKESFFHHIIPTLKFIPTKAQNSLKKANDFVHISPLSKRTSKTNAVVKLHLSSFSIVLLPRLCTWSLNTKKTSEQQKNSWR